MNFVEYGKIKECGEEQTYQFLINLGVNRRNVEETIERGRMRWKIENEGFNTQKRQVTIWSIGTAVITRQ